MQATKRPKEHKVSYSGTYYFAFMGEIPVGTVRVGRSNPSLLEIFRVPYFNPEDPAAYISNLEVYEKYIRKGIGTKLLRFSENVGFENGLEYSRLNAVAIPELTAFYFKNGYELLGSFPYDDTEINFFQKRLVSYNSHDSDAERLRVMIRE